MKLLIDLLAIKLDVLSHCYGYHNENKTMSNYIKKINKDFLEKPICHAFGLISRDIWSILMVTITTLIL